MIWFEPNRIAPIISISEKRHPELAVKQQPNFDDRIVLTELPRNEGEERDGGEHA